MNSWRRRAARGVSAARSARSAPRRPASPLRGMPRLAIARSTLAASVQNSRGQHREESNPAPVGERVVRVGDRRDLGPLGCGVVALEEVGDRPRGRAPRPGRRDRARRRARFEGRVGGLRGGGDRGSDGAAPRNYCPPAMRDALTGKVAIVTGASRGIGAAIARRFAAEGARVAIVARSLEPGSGGHLAGSLAEVAAAHLRRRRDRAADRGRSLRSGVRPRRARGAGRRRARARSTCWSTTRPRASTSRSTRPPSGACVSPTRSTRSRRTCSRRPRCPPCGSGATAGSSTSRASSPTPSPPGPKRSGQFARASTYAPSKASLNRLTEALATELGPHGIAVNAVAPEMAVATEGRDRGDGPAARVARADRGDGRGRARARDVRSGARERPGREVAVRTCAIEARPIRTLDGREPLAVSDLARSGRARDRRARAASGARPRRCSRAGARRS